MAGAFSGESAPVAAASDYKLASGAILDLNPNESIEIANPGRPNSGYGEFVQHVTRDIASSLGLPYEVLIRQFLSSYSAAKGALMEAWRTYSYERAWFTRRFDVPNWNRFVYECVAAGLVSAPGFFASAEIRAAYSRVSWGGPGRGMLDEAKEIKGVAEQIKLGIRTHRSSAIEITGTDWDANMDRLEVEEARKPKPPPVAPPGNEDADPDQSDIDEQNTQRGQA